MKTASPTSLNKTHKNVFEFICRFHEDQLYVIDVSQSVESDHPHGFEFLRKDCTNITVFFGRRHNVCTMTVKELFDFITDTSICESNIDAYLAEAMSVAALRSEQDATSEQLVNEEV